MDIIRRGVPPVPWAEGEKIPWNEPGFSERMLQNHLSQEHDWASRRLPVIERQVARIAALLPPGADVLDLGCGPGLYTRLLAGAGHRCTGVDFSPASIAYAKEQNPNGTAEYILEDIRRYVPAKPFDAALLTFGEINVFTEQDSRGILGRCASCLKPGGFLLLEAHAFDAVRAAGLAPASWYACEHGLFSERPHLCLEEHFWDEALAAATSRYFIIDAAGGGTAAYASSMQAYTDEQYQKLLAGAGFRDARKLDREEWPEGGDFAGKLEARLCRVAG